MHVEFVATDSQVLQSAGLPTGEAQVSLGPADQKFAWVPADQALGLAQHLHRRPGLQKRWGLEPCPAQPGAQRAALDDKAVALLPWTEESVGAVLRAHGDVDPEERLGRPLAQLAGQLCRGQLALGVRKADAQLLCVADVFSLLVASPEGKVLVDTGAAAEPAGLRAAKLPGAPRLAGEDAWTVARRIARGQLGIGACDLAIKEQLVQEVHPGSVALEHLDACAGGRRAPGLLLREFVVLAQVPPAYRVLEAVPEPTVR